MEDQQRNREELIIELRELRLRNLELEANLKAEISKRQECERQLLAKEVLEESEERLQVLMNYNPCLVFLKDELGRYVYINETYEKRFAGSKDWYGKTDFDFWSKESAELFQANDQIVLETGRVTQNFEDSKDLDGTRHCWLNYKFPYTDSKNRRYSGGIGIDVTERILAEEALRKSEEARYASEKKYRELIEDSPAAIYEIDPQGERFTFVNTAVCDLTGYSREELLAMNPKDLLDDQSQAAFAKRAGDLLNGLHPDDQVEYTIIGKNGRKISAVLNTSFKTDQNGKPIGATVIAQDIGQLKRIEIELKQSREKYQALVETNVDFIWEMDAQGRYTYCSPQMEKLWGIKPESMLGRTPFDLLPPAEKEHALNAFLQYAQSPSGLKEYATASYNGRGELIFIETSAVPFFDDAGILLGLRGTTRDITESKLAQMALEKSEAKYREIVKHAPAGIYEISFRGQCFLSVNDAMCEVTGYSREELLTMNPADLMDDPSKLRFQTRIKQWLSGEEPEKNVEYLIKSKDGRDIWAELYVSFTFDENGMPLGATVISYDITDRKKAEVKARTENMITLGINRILHYALFCESEEELGMNCLNVALDITGSSIGFMDEINQKGSVDVISISQLGWDACRIPGSGCRELPNGLKMQGLKGRAMLQGKAFFTNAPEYEADGVGIPTGHPPLNSFIAAPFFENGQVIGVIGLSNKAGGYTNDDLCILEKLTPSITQALRYRRSRKALRENEARLRALTITSNNVIYRMNPNWTSITELYGSGDLAEIREPDGNWHDKYIHPLDQELATGVIDECIRDKKPYELEHRAPRADGSIGWTRSKAIPILDGSGEIMEWFGTACDITERKRAEEVLLESEANLRVTEAISAERQRLYNVLETLPVMICLLTPDYHVAFANRNFRDRFGEANGRHCYEYCYGYSEPCDFCESYKVLETGKPHSWEVNLDGAIIDAYDVPFTDVDGSPMILEMNIDITERRRIDKEMARLDRLNLIGEMAASIGHEIRNPMTSVRGFLQMLGSKPEYQDDNDYFELMIEELDRANSIITEYLGMAKDKRIDLQSRSLDIIITALYPMLMSDANLREINIHLDLCTPPQISIDEREIRQLIINMARNGMEAMSSNGTLTIGTRRDGNEVILFIKDEGSGLSSIITDKIGTPFLTTKENGTGLGLAVCYSIAARHNARIDYETGLEGTTFYVRFPPRV